MSKLVAVEDGRFVRLASEAPVRGHVDEYGSSGLGEVFNQFRRVAVPSVFGDELCRSRFEYGVDFGFVFGGGECEPECGEGYDGYADGDDFSNKRNSRRGDFPDGKAENHAEERDDRKDGDAVVSGLLAHDPQKPCDCTEQENSHDFLESHHPGARFWENFQDARECADEHVGERKADARRGEEQEEDWRRGGERETHGGAEERG